MKDLSQAVDKMLHEKVSSSHVEYFMAENVERRKRQAIVESVNIQMAANENADSLFNDSLVLELNPFLNKDDQKKNEIDQSSDYGLENNITESALLLLQKGITPFPYKVAKALDSDIYRNIEYDVWNEIRKEYRFWWKHDDGSTLQVGSKCLCRLDPDQNPPYRCHIQVMPTKQTHGIVFVEELGEKRQVSCDQLELLPPEESKPWAPPYRLRHQSQCYAIEQLFRNIGNMYQKCLFSKIRNKQRPINEDDGSDGTICKKKSFYGSEFSKIKENEKDEDGILVELQNGILQSANVWDITSNSPSGYNLVPNTVDLTNYQHLDYMTFQPYPVEVIAMPLMVDCHPPSSSAMQHASRSDHTVPNQNGPGDPVQGQQQPSTAVQGTTADMRGNTMTPPSTARTSTPANTQPTMTPYAVSVPYCGAGGGAPCVVWGGAGKPLPPQPLLLCAPHHHPHMNPNVQRSIMSNGSDLPMNDIQTLRYYYNRGIDCAFGICIQNQPRMMSVTDLSQDMQQSLSLMERPPISHYNMSQNQETTNMHVLKSNHPGPGHNMSGSDKMNSGNGQGKGNGQRTLLGPRFKRGVGGGGDNSQTGGGNNKPNMGKGSNSRRHSHNEQGGRNNHNEPSTPEGALPAEGPMLVTNVPYMPYPPPSPFYHVPYYPVEGDMAYAPPAYMTYGMPEEVIHAPEPYGLPPPQYVGYGPPAYWAGIPPPPLPHYAPPQPEPNNK